MRAALALLLALPLAFAGSTPKVLRALKVGGEGGWDYVTLDAEARRIYLPRSTRVMVLDLDGKTIGEIADTPGVHGVALAPALDRGFTSNGRGDSVTIFQLSTLKVLQIVKVTGGNPDAILFEPSTQRVFTFNGSGKNATVFEAATGKVLGTIPLGGKPEFPAADGRGCIFVNIEDTHQIAVLDAKAMKELHRWDIAPLEDPTGLALDDAHHRLFAVGGNQLMAVVDAQSGKVVKTLPIGKGADAAAFDAATQTVYSSNGDGTLTLIHEDSPNAFTVLASVPTKRGARTMALDPKTHQIFLPAAEYGPAPAATPEQPRPRPAMVKDSFHLLVVGND
jgi:DNA-binding beta-propeller fold protein YncE